MLLYRKILQRVDDTIKNNRLIQKDDKVLVALSGGSDSVFLMYVLSELKEKYSFSLSAAHVNHKLRKEADSEEIFASNLCKNLNIEFFSTSVDIKNIVKNSDLSCETAGRNARYSFFNELKKEHGFTKIATAHHRDDNAETILMHFIRGSGGNGLSGIDFIRSDGVIRPLLNISKVEILNCCLERQLDYVSDSSNFEPLYSRNRVRLELIPQIMKYNSNFSQIITQNAVLFADDENFINEYTMNIFKENYSHGSIKKKAVDAQPVAIKRRLFQQLYRIVSKTEQNLSQKYIHALLALSQTGQKLSLPNKMTAILSYNAYEIYKEDDKICEFDLTLEIGIPLFLPEINKYWLVRPANPNDEKIFVLPCNATLAVKNRKHVTVFYPIGMNGRKKISDFFIDKKIPAKLRDTIPILTANDEVVNVGGIHFDRRFYNTKEKNNVFYLEIYEKI